MLIMYSLYNRKHTCCDLVETSKPDLFKKYDSNCVNSGWTSKANKDPPI